jgi:hypothetical protein
MTPERQKALEAVAEAAREHKAAWPGPDLPDARIKLHAAITALDALPPDPATAGEVVEVAVWEYPDGDIWLVRRGACGDDWPGKWTRIGTTRLPLTEGGR